MRQRGGGGAAKLPPPPPDAHGAEQEDKKDAAAAAAAAATTADEDGESTTEDEDRSGIVHSGRSRRRRRPVEPSREHARPAKRLKQNDGNAYDGSTCVASPTVATTAQSVEGTSEGATPPLWSLDRRVSPPARRAVANFEAKADDDGIQQSITGAPAEARQLQGLSDGLVRTQASSSATVATGDGGAERKRTTFVPSPVQLTRIQDLSPAANVDAVALGDIVGDPLIVEMWQFNYLFDVDFLMDALDEDVRGSMRIKVVHGSWRREDTQRQMLEHCAKRYPNLEVIQAYMPEAFGTHHSKMMILIRADDTAQVVIHTANMIAKDWTNMTNAVWRSPLLPLLPEKTDQFRANAAASVATKDMSGTESMKYPIGTGQRFKIDLLRYLSAYGKRLYTLRKQLLHYDFSAIRAALVASTPSRVKLTDSKPDKHTSWGWVGLREVLSRIPFAKPSVKKPAAGISQNGAVVAQVSSIATLDQSGAWLEHFRSVLGASRPVSSSSSMAASSSPSFHLVFPTVADVRGALDGYRAGASIHYKPHGSAARQRQLGYLRPYFCRWSGGDTSSHHPSSALRARAAPHVKTYVRYQPSTTDTATPPQIAWAMLTSANLSTQAWGALPAAPGGRRGGSGGSGRGTGKSDEEVRICSWEVGVVIWPALFAADGPPVRQTEEGDMATAASAADMVPVFGRDAPLPPAEACGDDDDDDDDDDNGGDAAQTGADAGVSERPPVRVGWRMPYDWPLAPYRDGDEPWCPNASYAEPDLYGCVWDGM